ncbi:hypothetical protein BC828DRAFT_396537 [Blastocladiella britannica]|nr:hypothetical protein BC828DRAFT_396537 [Blastocladiella britannica]
MSNNRTSEAQSPFPTSPPPISRLRPTLLPLPCDSPFYPPLPLLEIVSAEPAAGPSCTFGSLCPLSTSISTTSSSSTSVTTTPQLEDKSFYFPIDSLWSLSTQYPRSCAMSAWSPHQSPAVTAPSSPSVEGGNNNYSVGRALASSGADTAAVEWSILFPGTPIHSRRGSAEPISSPLRSIQAAKPIPMPLATPPRTPRMRVLTPAIQTDDAIKCPDSPMVQQHQSPGLVGVMPLFPLSGAPIGELGLARRSS